VIGSELHFCDEPLLFADNLAADCSDSARRARFARAMLALQPRNYYAVTMTMPTVAERKARTTTAVRLPEDLHEQLRRAADERGFSVNFMVTKAVEDFIRRLIPADELKLTRD